jgi:glycosyltransferase involved in cell wall biosynthesis
MEKISACIIAFNEESKIVAAINSVLWADEVVVIDSFSKDATARLAQELGARVVQVPFNGFGDLRNQAMAACQYPWIFSLDCDERCTQEATDEILDVINNHPKHDAFYMPRRNYFMGRWIKHCGWYPNYRQPQLFRKEVMSYDNSAVHERFTVDSDLPIGHLKKAIWQIPFENLSEMMHKANRYSTLGVDRVQKKFKRVSMLRALAHGLFIFLRIYFLNLGFLDGWAGFMIATGNFYGTFFRYAKAFEKQETWGEPTAMPLTSKEIQGEVNESH